MREVIRYEHDKPGGMLHVDVKKLGRIPIGTDAARAGTGQGTGKVGCTYLHSALEDIV